MQNNDFEEVKLYVLIFENFFVLLGGIFRGNCRIYYFRDF